MTSDDPELQVTEELRLPTPPLSLKERLQRAEYTFLESKGKIKNDQKECKDTYGNAIYVANPYSLSRIHYPLQCFKYKDVGKSGLRIKEHVVTVRVDRIRKDMWWNSIDSKIRGDTINELRDVLKNSSYKALADWAGGTFEILYLEDTPVYVNFLSQVAVVLVVVDGIVMPNGLVRQLLQMVLDNSYKGSTFISYYTYTGIPETYMSTLVWSHNELMASILACVTLGSIILLVMVAAIIAGVKSSDDDDEDDTDFEEEDEEEGVGGIQETVLKGEKASSSKLQWAGKNNLEGEAEVIVNTFNITATGQEEARCEAEINLDQEEIKPDKKCALPPPKQEGKKNNRKISGKKSGKEGVKKTSGKTSNKDGRGMTNTYHNKLSSQTSEEDNTH